MAGLGQPRQLDHSGVRSLLRDGRLVIFVGVPRLKIFQKAVKRRVQAGHHADLAIAPRSAKQIPLKESANRADRSAVSANLHHNLILEDRSAMNLSGVTDVDCFDERTIRLYTQLGELVIKGKNLHIDTVSVETGDMRVSGDIWSLQYGDKDRKGALSALGKLFR